MYKMKKMKKKIISFSKKGKKELMNYSLENFNRQIKFTYLCSNDRESTYVAHT